MSQVVIKVIENYTYQTNNSLGQGVYGKVYLGTQRNTKQKVAIKRIQLSIFTKDKYSENSIRSQIKLLQKFSHPNIIKFIDVLNSKSNLYIVTEYCKDGDLKQLIKKRKKMSQQEAFDIITQILSGFTQLVQQKIIHRDLKPANILINNGVFKIADFGFARYVDNFGTQMLKSLVGSPIYMAPQILQRQQYTTKCDIWSIGVMFYEMIMGRHPWTGRDQYDLLRSIQNISISSLLKRQTISTKATDFLKNCLAFREQNRVSWDQLFDNFLKNKTNSKLPQLIIQKNDSITTFNKSSTHLISNITPIKTNYSSNIVSTQVPSPSRLKGNIQTIVNGKQVTSNNNREFLTNNREILLNNRQSLPLNRETIQTNKQIIQGGNKQLITPIKEGIRQYTSLIRQKQLSIKPNIGTTTSLIRQSQKIIDQQIVKKEQYPVIREPPTINIRQRQTTLNVPRQVIPISSSRQPISTNKETFLTFNRQTLTNREGTSTSNIRQFSNKDIQPQTNNKREFNINRQLINKQTSNRQTPNSPTYSALSPEGLKKTKEINAYKHKLLEQLLLISRPQFFDPYKCDKLLYLLGQSIRTRSVSTLGLINFVMKTNKGVQQLAASAVKQHKVYEQTQKNINQMCSQNIQKIKQQLDNGSFRHEIINQQRIKKLQKSTSEVTFELLKILLGELRRRNNQKLTHLLQILINLVSNQPNNTYNIEKLVDSKEKLMRLIEKGEQLCY